MRCGKANRALAVYYLETLALLKRYRTEKGTEVVDELIDSKRDAESLITSYFTVLEIVSVSTRLLRAGAINKPIYRRMIANVEKDTSEAILVQPASDAVHAEAIRQAMTHGLRAPDAIHLATALRVREAIGEPLYFVCADAKLIAACVACGINIVNPEVA